MALREIQAQMRRCGEHEYEVTPLPAGKALQALRRLGRAVGPAAAQLGALDSKNAALDALGKALEIAFDGLSDDDVAFLNRTFAEATAIVDGDGRAPLARQFDVHFQGALDEWWEWMRFSLEVNFGPLLKALGVKGGTFGAKAKA